MRVEEQALTSPRGATRRRFIKQASALLASATGFLVVGGLAFALALRVLDAGLRPSLNRVGTGLLYVPVSAAKRRLLKPSIDTLGQRGGQTLASVLLLLLMEMSGATFWIAGSLCIVAGSSFLTIGRRALRSRPALEPLIST